MVSWRERKKYQVIFLSLLNDRTSNENGDYTLDDGTLITIENGKVSNIEVPEQEDSAEDTDED